MPRCLREGYRVVLAGPPNAGKSTLFNALGRKRSGDYCGRAPEPPAMCWCARWRWAGCRSASSIPPACATRAPRRSKRSGLPVRRRNSNARILLLWLGPEGEGPHGAWEIEAQIDRTGHSAKAAPRSRGFRADAVRASAELEARACKPCDAGDSQARRNRAQCAAARTAGRCGGGAGRGRGRARSAAARRTPAPRPGRVRPRWPAARRPRICSTRCSGASASASEMFHVEHSLTL